MAAKLKSISKQIHWSLLLRAAIFALAWFFLPFWLFLLVALYLYFIPLFQSRRLFWPFFALLVLAYLQPTSLIFLVIFATLFYYLLLIKDLLLIDRKTAHELLILALNFFLIRSFYEHFGTELMTSSSIFYGLLVAALIGFLINSFFESGRRLASWLVFVLIWQFLLLGLFLPLDFAYQSAVVFLVSTLIVDLIPEDHPERRFTTGIIIGVLFAIVLLSARWGL